MAQRVLSALERAKLVCWFEETNSLVKVARRYRAEFGMDPPVKLETIKKWHQKFLETGSVMPTQTGISGHIISSGLRPENELFVGGHQPATYIFAERFSKTFNEGSSRF